MENGKVFDFNGTSSLVAIQQGPKPLFGEKRRAQHCHVNLQKETGGT